MKLRRSKAEVRQAVLDYLKSQTAGRGGYDIAKATKVGYGRVYSILDDLLADGAVWDSWGEPDPKRGLRRRYYHAKRP